MKMKNHDKAFAERDLFLLENQLPFKVLEALMTMNSKFAGEEGLKLISKSIQDTRPSHPLPSFWESMENCITNITCRQLIGTSGIENGGGGNNWYEPLIIRAILSLPPMKIDDSTQSLLLNLAAYEMCPDSPNDFRVTSYIWFMDTLIDHADDVKELRKKGILLNYLGNDEELAGLFNEIAKNLVPNSQAYADVQDQIEKY
ncbi:uncharacterized protein LOC114276713 [Camellia sinensis]|uniref:uncharacterized protein LOC114276713 n=1 Tax=Camellia sinensis TaxID=4442 RepID=UPI00103630C9|nr:uncharacterized protein LOC114276713 [Camellia sinensis]